MTKTLDEADWCKWQASDNFSIKNTVKHRQQCCKCKSSSKPKKINLGQNH